MTTQVATWTQRTSVLPGWPWAGLTESRLIKEGAMLTGVRSASQATEKKVVLEQLGPGGLAHLRAGELLMLCHSRAPSVLFRA